MIKITHYMTDSEKIAEEFDNFKIVQLSDLHGRIYYNSYEEILTALRKINPDIVVLTGDIADNRLKKSIPNAEVFCRLISEKYETYFVHGNHEQTMKSEVLDDFMYSLKKLEIQILDNSRHIIKKGNAEIVLNGLVTPIEFYNDPFHEYHKGTILQSDEIRKLLGNIDEKKYNILLAHNPIFFDAYCEWGADLILSGHMHGGVIYFPGVGGLLSPDVSFFPKYDAGKFERNGKQMIVSRGLNNRFPFSITNPSEIVCVTLLQKL